MYLSGRGSRDRAPASSQPKRDRLAAHLDVAPTLVVDTVAPAMSDAGANRPRPDQDRVVGLTTLGRPVCPDWRPSNYRSAAPRFVHRAEFAESSDFIPRSSNRACKKASLFVECT